MRQSAGSVAHLNMDGGLRVYSYFLVPGIDARATMQTFCQAPLCRDESPEWTVRSIKNHSDPM